MSFLNIFKKNQNNVQIDELLSDARKLLEEQNYFETLDIVFSVLQIDVEYLPTYEIASECFYKLELQEESDLFISMLEKKQTENNLYNIGNYFQELMLYKLSLQYFLKLHKYNRGNCDYAHDLSISYARTFNIEKAIEVLEKVKYQNDFWVLWYWSKLKILSRDIKFVPQTLSYLFKVINHIKDEEHNLILKIKVDELKEMLDRYRSISNPKLFIQDWQFIQYGNIILNFESNDDNNDSHGRYAYLSGSNESVCHTVLLLKEYLNIFETKIEHICYLPSRDSEILAHLASMVFNVSVELYNENTVKENSLIIGSNSYEFNEYPEFASIDKNQILFSYYHIWTKDSFLSSDIIGYMAQVYNYPWYEGMKIIDLKQRKMEKTPEDKRNPITIAKDIFYKSVELHIDKDSLLFYLKHRDYLKVFGNLSNQYRYNFFIETPVPATYFGEKYSDFYKDLLS